MNYNYKCPKCGTRPKEIDKYTTGEYAMIQFECLSTNCTVRTFGVKELIK